ncbi:cucumber peeling cupredoxin-like [Macadamia integrifolia]|uniref:cucumber peeling cupredoxin-like n=1 Tax=Macadamia integrifolia TaxID=60698 RepID=UPI001C4EDF5C|nr:cucumber peeling cupredoxin-like [Macadamia integrifolia]
MDEERRIPTSSITLFFFFFLFFALLSFSGSIEAYKNYTVGDSLGWYDKLQNPKVDYQKWVANKTFSLGDFLIFNTDTNHSIVQTYNLTTYKQCDFEDAEIDDTTEWSSAEPNATNPQPVTVAVPLVKEGMTYFFSSDYDGEQCQYGQHFKINVTHGQGLPPSLMTPPSMDSPGPANPDMNNPDSAPDTVVPSNFNTPKDQAADGVTQESGSASLKMFLRHVGWRLNGILMLLGLVCVYA